MRYRQFFYDGKPTDRVDSTVGEFGVDEAVGIAEVAAQLGVEPSLVTVEYPADIPSAPQVVIPPTVDDGPSEPPFAALLTAIANARDFAELKAAVALLRG